MTQAQQQMFRFEPVKRAAAQQPERRNLVIEAGAGTGKTTAIVAEVLRLLLADGDLDPQRIVLVTFTEKAAAEIAERVHAALQEIAAGAVTWPPSSQNPLITVPEGGLEACAKHIERIDLLRSQTIHSFCQNLLRQHAIEAGLDPQFRVIEGFERAHFVGSVYDTWIDEETRVHPSPQVTAEWEALLDHAGYLFLARKQIFDLLDRRDLLIDPQFTLGEMAELEPQLLDAIKMLNASKMHDAPIVKYVRATKAPAAGSSIDAWIEYFAPIAPQIRNENLTKSGDQKAAIKVLRAGDKGDSVYDLLVSHRAAVALLSLTTRFIRRLDAEKRKRGVLDFDDLLIQTYALLENATVLERVRAQFDVLFVDEFQDTDRIQARIIERLARDASGAFVPGKTIVVGDPKQSIYGFRRADPELYDEMTRKLVAGGADSRFLTGQYRSEPALVAATNTIFARVLAGGEPDPNVFRPAYHDLTAARPQEHAEPPITLLACDSEEKSERFTREAEVIGEWIRRNAADGGYRRFALLFRRMTHIDSYLDVFEKQHIPYVLPPSRVFLDRPAPVDLLAVLRAVAYPTDRGAEISAACTPYFALTDTEIVENGATYASFAAALRSMRDEARHLTVSQLVALIIERTRIEEVYHACADGDRSLRHLDHLRQLAFQYDQTTGGSVRQFVDEIDRRRTEPDEVEPALFDDSKDAVRILTVHGSKGLEFETVILPDMQFGSKGIEAFTVADPPSLVLRNSINSLSGVARRSGERPLREIGSLRDDAESRRLFYVAVTRARRNVAFVHNIVKPRKEGFTKFLCEALPIDLEMFPGVHEIDGIRIAFEKMPPATEESRRRRRLLVEVPEELVPAGISEAAPILPATPPRAGATHKTAGILLHRVLERWDGASAVDGLLNALANEIAAEPPVVERVRKRLDSIRGCEMLQRIARAETVGREMNVSFLDANGTIVHKRLDRVLQENGGGIVLDYKSGEPAKERVAKDKEQVATYCMAMERLTGRPHRGILWYIDDDRNVIISVDGGAVGR